MIRRLLSAVLAAGLLSGCLPAGGSGAGAPAGAPQPTRMSAASGDRAAALMREFEALAPADQRLTVRGKSGLFAPHNPILAFNQNPGPNAKGGDLILQVDVSTRTPVYRVIFNQPNFSPDGLKALPSDLSLFSLVGEGDWTAEFAVPDFARTWKGDGLFVSDWLTCDACFPERTAKMREESYRRSQAKVIDQIRKEAAGRGLVEVTTVRLRRFPDIVRGSIVAGRAAATASAAGASQRLDSSRAQLAEGQRHAPAYFAFREEVAKTTLAGYVEQIGCPEKVRATTSGGAREWREILRHNDRYIDCRIEAIEAYDHAGFAEAFPGIAAREKELAARAVGVKRPPLYTPEGQVKEVVKEIERAEAANEHAAYAVDYYQEQRAKRERERLRLQASMLAFQRSINAAQAQVRDMAPVVRSDGTVSTVGAERRRAASGAWPTSGRRNGGGSGAGRRPGDRPSSGGGRRSASDGGSDRGYSLFVSTEYGTGKIAERCDPLGVMGQHTARCRVIEVVRHFRVHHAKCPRYDDGSVMPAEVVLQNTHLIVSLDGLTAAEQSRIEAEAEKVGRPYAASTSPNVVRNLVRDDYAAFGTAAPGVRTYYASEWDMKRDLRARGCVSYELDGTVHALN